jgi:hypothetical protein
MFHQDSYDPLKPQPSDFFYQACPLTYKYINSSEKLPSRCAKDCSAMNYVNCGVACAVSSGVCAANIVSMVISVLLSIAQSLLLIVSFGASAPATEALAGAKNSIKNAIVQAGTEAMNAAVSHVRKIATNTIKDKIIGLAQSFVKNAVSSELMSAATEQCRAIGLGIFAKITADAGQPVSFDLTNLDPTGISSAAVTCNDKTQNDYALNCAKAVVSAVSMVDPTGLLSVVASFMNPTCPEVYWK